jgi:hypothetical protein
VHTNILARLGKKVTATMNTHAIIEEFLDALISMQAVPNQKKAGY